MTEPALQSAEHFIVPNRIGGQLSIWRYHGERPQADVVLVHDVLDNASVFGNQQSGLVQLLCQSGFNVWTCNLHGYGDSWPSISRRTRYSLEEATLGDLALVMKSVQRYQALPIYLLGKGTGGVLWQHYLLTESIHLLAGVVLWQHPFFVPSPKRRVRRLLAWLLGYQPAWFSGQRVVGHFHRQVRRASMPKMTRAPVTCYVHQGGDRDQYALVNCVGPHNGQVLLAAKREQQQAIADWLQSSFATPSGQPLVRQDT